MEEVGLDKRKLYFHSDFPRGAPNRTTKSDSCQEEK